MKVNRGKEFEGQIRTAFEQVPNTYVMRLIDPQNGFAGVRNICDFVVYRYPCQFLIECKSCYGNTFSIHTNNPEHRYGLITNNQWEGLLECSKVFGIVAGYMIWFIDHDKTIFVEAETLAKYREAGNKSISILKFDPNKYLDIKCTKRRVLFDYDLNDFVKEEVRSYGYYLP